jgi:uncharacterized membrane protein YqjE
MAASGSARPSGFVSALRALADGLFAGVQDRLRLLSIELQEEKFRVIQTLAWIGAAMFSGALAFAFASLALVYYFWDTARLAVLGGLAIFYGVVTIAVLLALRRFLRRQPPPFAASLDEIEQDRTCMRGGGP